MKEDFKWSWITSDRPNYVFAEMDGAFLQRGGENLALLTLLSSHDPRGLHTMKQEESWTITLLVPSLTYPPR